MSLKVRIGHISDRLEVLICSRISLLVVEERSSPRLYVHHKEAHLFLRLLAEKICKQLWSRNPYESY